MSKAGRKTPPLPMEKPVASSLPGEASTDTHAEASPQKATPVEPIPLTEQKLVEILTAWDQKIQAREQEGLHNLLDTLVGQLTKNKEESMKNAGTNLGTQGTSTEGESIQGFFSQIQPILKQFGLMEGNQGGGELEMQFAKMIRDGYGLYLKREMKQFATANGLPWHELEGADHV